VGSQLKSSQNHHARAHARRAPDGQSSTSSSTLIDRSKRPSTGDVVAVGPPEQELRTAHAVVVLLLVHTVVGRRQGRPPGHRRRPQRVGSRLWGRRRRRRRRRERATPHAVGQQAAGEQVVRGGRGSGGGGSSGRAARRALLHLPPRGAQHVRGLPRRAHHPARAPRRRRRARRVHGRRLPRQAPRADARRLPAAAAALRRRPPRRRRRRGAAPPRERGAPPRPGPCAADAEGAVRVVRRVAVHALRRLRGQPPPVQQEDRRVPRLRGVQRERTRPVRRLLLRRLMSARSIPLSRRWWKRRMS
jgi:hypothetical protein